MRVAMVSGGKDSLYAALKAWPIDLGLLLMYEFPIPSPHLINLGKSVETLLLAGIPVAVLKLRKGRERDLTAGFLRMLGVDELIAGDVYVEDHLKYMEGLARDVGCGLREPLWGASTDELTREVFREGFKALIIGADSRLREWVGKELSGEVVEDFISSAKEVGADPLGEMGEYHTLVIDSPLHERGLTYEVGGLEEFNNYSILKVV